MKWSGTNQMTSDVYRMASGVDRPVLVIGYGNSLRRDDGAGLLLAQELVSRWNQSGLPATLLTAHQLDPELAVDVVNSEAEIILFVDAAIPTDAHSPAVELSRIASVPDAVGIGHHLTPASVMLYATQLYDFVGEAWLLSIPGFDFDHGEGLSEDCAALVHKYIEDHKSAWTILQNSIDPTDELQRP
jgi:hydrogenase maturation protease